MDFISTHHCILRILIRIASTVEYYILLVLSNTNNIYVNYIYIWAFLN